MGKKHRAKKNGGGCRGGAKMVPRASRVPVGEGMSVVAIHEAGHAVARLELFGDLVQVSVKAKGGGFVDHAEFDPSAASVKELKAYVVVLYSGAAAVERFCASDARLGVERDLMVAQLCARYGGFSLADMLSLADDAASLVASHEPEIRAVAKRLHRCGRLWGGTVAKIAAAARSGERG